MSKKFVYMFTEADESLRNLVGGKGANLGAMTKLGLPIPQGFTVSTEACTKYYKDGGKISDDIVKEIFKAVKELEKISGKKFGDPKNPLLVSVRSGARVSMPGMMDTILNLGLNDEVVAGLSKATGNPRFANDSYRRFIQMYSDVVLGFDKTFFERIIDEMKEEKGIKLDTEFSDADLVEMVKRFKAIYREKMNADFPTDPKEQLLGAIGAVFNSWENPRAEYYRRMNGIPSEWGTAVNVQEMVYGNMGDTSGTGVAFSRNPATGENKVFGEYLINAQGEDVVAGIRTPEELDTLKDVLPEAYEEFMRLIKFLEVHYKDMQDVEFTIENKKLYFLQTRSGKRTAQAALKIAVDLVHEGLITEEDAILQVGTEHLDNLLHPHFDQDELKATKPIGSGLPASPGAATGVTAFNVEQVLEFQAKGLPSVLVRLETSPEDIEGMHVSEGFLTARGGMTSHAAVVARGMGKTCVAGAHELVINEDEGWFELGGKRLQKGDWIALDGTTGQVYAQKIKTVPVEITGDFEEFMGWVDKHRTLGVRTNADTPADAKQALSFGAEGIGLTRTEHMFFDGVRIKAMREMIVARTEEQRRNALDKLLPIQQQDFEELIVAMEGHPITVRYLDPPLHEFLPTQEADIVELAKELKITVEELKQIIVSLHEFNPMMGHRGCRLSVSYPELAEMQTTALISAYINVSKRHPEWTLVPEIMIPLVGDVKELTFVKNVVVKTADKLIKEAKSNLTYKVGTMMEIPRACLLADEVAKEAEFFSFGTNDLTQMAFGFSRDDAATFLKDYYDKRIYEFDPFQTIDQKGVGELVKMGVKLGRKGNKDLQIGICGEHGGDPRSVEFFHKVGLDYVSCSPFRVPIAKLAAAQAAIKEKRAK
ncbi:MAG: pyruvate, phosphate dikinase [Acholeplasmataceae bacterium]|nr:pyruvate, phosphate dikinase [Acholeplasmataceae bacterium]